MGAARESVPCHLCSSTRSRAYLEGRGFFVVRCEDGGLYWVNPQPSAQELAEIYRDFRLARPVATWFGTGLGSTVAWYDPYLHTIWTQETVDVGWAYLLIKLGVVGLAVFLWLVGASFSEP